MVTPRPAAPDEFSLERFVHAQTGVYPRVIEELRAGEKHSHWMWFIFPQIAGLGSSEMAQRFAISGRAEAVAYLRHPVLGPRLHECVALVNAVPAGRRIEQIFGYPDNLKFCSSVTLFHSVAADEASFRYALERFFGGVGDPATLRRLAG